MKRAFNIKGEEGRPTANGEGGAGGEVFKSTHVRSQRRLASARGASDQFGSVNVCVGEYILKKI